MYSTIVVFTGSYPYCAALEQTFLQEEVKALASAFQRVVIVPSRAEGTPSDVPQNVEIDATLALTRTNFGRRLQAVLTGLWACPVVSETIHHSSSVATPAGLCRMARWISDAVLVRHWGNSFLRMNPDALAGCIFYTYWCGGATLGCILAARRTPSLRVITRAHGFDVYAERHQPAYLPFQKFILNHVWRAFPISRHGANYLTSRLSLANDRFKVSRLGVPDSGFIARHSNDGVWRIASCSYAVPVKRVPFIAQSIAIAALRNPEQRLEWFHFGGGPSEHDVRRIVQTAFPRNARYTSFGSVPNSAVMEFYRTHPVDVFINLSDSEGIPVAGMEALSVGLPILALDVGGMSELVSTSNGVLLPASSDSAAVGEALANLLRDATNRSRRIQASRERWQAYFDARDNFRGFVRELCEDSSGA